MVSTVTPQQAFLNDFSSLNCFQTSIYNCLTAVKFFLNLNSLKIQSRYRGLGLAQFEPLDQLWLIYGPESIRSELITPVFVEMI